MTQVYESISIFLDREFKKRRTKKPFIVYKKIVHYYDEYPVSITELLNNLYNIGYWKDYFYILLASKNEKLNTIIYNFLAETFQSDVTKYQHNQKITTLAKWLPREKSGFDKKIFFVDRFIKIIYPKIKNKFMARKEYRKTITMLNMRLNTAEISLCNKKHQDLNFETMGPICFKKYYTKFIDDENHKDSIRNRIYNLFDKYELWDFVKSLLFNKYDDYHKNIIIQVWEKKIDVFLESLNFIDFNYDFLVDLSKTVFETNTIIYIVSTILLGCEKNPKFNIFINCRDPYIINLRGNIFEKIQLILDNCCPSKKIYMDEMCNKNNENHDKKIVVLTNKKDDLNFYSINKKINIIHWDLSTSKNKNMVAIKKNTYTKILWHPIQISRNNNMLNNLQKVIFHEYVKHKLYQFIIILFLMYLIYLFMFHHKYFY